HQWIDRINCQRVTAGVQCRATGQQRMRQSWTAIVGQWTELRVDRCCPGTDLISGEVKPRSTVCISDQVEALRVIRWRRKQRIVKVRGVGALAVAGYDRVGEDYVPLNCGHTIAITVGC